MKNVETNPLLVFSSTFYCSPYYIARSHALILLSAPRRLARVADRLRLSGI
jgi:hypothetical protein